MTVEDGASSSSPSSSVGISSSAACTAISGSASVAPPLSSASAGTGSNVSTINRLRSRLTSLFFTYTLSFLVHIHPSRQNSLVGHAVTNKKRISVLQQSEFRFTSLFYHPTFLHARKIRTAHCTIPCGFFCHFIQGAKKP